MTTYNILIAVIHIHACTQGANIYLYLCLITYITREREMKLGGDRVWEKKDKKKREGGMFHSFILSIKALGFTVDWGGRGW